MEWTLDKMTEAMAELKIEIAELLSDMRRGFSEIRGEMAGIRADMRTNFRWIMGGICGSTLIILVAILVAVLAKG